MRRIQHIGFVLLLGVWVLFGCQRENPAGSQESQDAPEQIVFGPAKASLYLSVRGYGDSYTLTKADYVDVDKTLHYDFEKHFKDLRVLIFDASQVSEAYRTESGKYVFDPSGAKYVACAEPEFMEADGENVRVDFTLDKPYASLALILLANFHSYPAGLMPGTTMDAVISLLTAQGVDFVTDQKTYVEDGLPMHGWKLFGSLEGLSSPASAEEIQKRQLRYYKGISTPLTVVGFQTASELEHYARKVGGTGAVRPTDKMNLNYALSRLHLRYEPEAGQLSKDSVWIKEVSVQGYRKKYHLIPAEWNSKLNWEGNPFEKVEDCGDLENAQKVNFYKLSDHDFVAYVPELDSAAVKTMMASDPAFLEPGLSVKLEMISREDGKKWEFNHVRGTGITMKDDASNEYTYTNTFWTVWTQFRTVNSKKKTDGVTDVPVGTMYNLVRQYSYEWVATGIEK